MRLLLELLSFRIRQALVGRDRRISRARFMRASTAQTSVWLGQPRRLFIDLAVISGYNGGTGIQRVVRALALALQRAPSTKWDIRFVGARRNTRYFRIGWPNSDPNIAPHEMRARPGDIFLGLDYSVDAVRWHRRQLAQFRRDGGALWFLVHDLLPLHHPEWFSRRMVIRHKAWLDVLAGLADGFFCNSPQTEAELRGTLATRYGLVDGYRTQVLPMAHSLLDQRCNGATSVARSQPRFDLSKPFALIVGTLEPRKGHADVIEAFGALWARGRTEKLVLVGRVGWCVDGLLNFIVTHKEFGSRLLWFDDVEDDELSQIYEAATGVLIASYGEGFGLPLIEALGHGKPVLARDLPVFRAHEGKGVKFFPVNAQPAQLMDCIERWFCAALLGEISVVSPRGSWEESASILLASFDSEPDQVATC